MYKFVFCIFSNNLGSFKSNENLKSLDHFGYLTGPIFLYFFSLCALLTGLKRKGLNWKKVHGGLRVGMSK